jgi:hypothetical protein
MNTGNGTRENLEVTVEVDPKEFPEEAMQHAKDFVKKNLNDRLQVTFGDLIKSKQTKETKNEQSILES